MKGFYSQSSSLAQPSQGALVSNGSSSQDAPAPAGCTRQARLAIYDSPAAAPRTVDVREESEAMFIESLSSKTYTSAREAGGEIPYTVIRELCENLIHADFQEPVVSVLDRGATIRIADQGPGIPDKDRARLPGFTSASGSMKHLIRGVGSGLPIVREYLAHYGGTLDIDDNLGSGTVVTVRTRRHSEEPADLLLQQQGTVPGVPGDSSARSASPSVSTPHPPLSNRQKQVLSLVLEVGEAGPTSISRELSVALSTAHRDLAYLEQQGLITSTESGKRILTAEGSAYLDSLFSL